MAWDARFDRQIALPSGRIIHTLRQAAEHIMALPKSESAILLIETPRADETAMERIYDVTGIEF